MKGRKGTFLFTMLWASLAVGIFSCDTANNVEDPGLHYFVKYYGGNGNQRGVDMLALNDGTFMLLGNYSETDFKSDIYLVKVDALGKVIWENRYRFDIGGYNAEAIIYNARDIEPTGDGNFIILSDFQGGIAAQTDMILVKISPDGTMLDSHLFGSRNVDGTPTDDNDYGRTVTPLDDGGFIVSGTSVPAPPLDNGSFINYRFNSDLDKLSINEWDPVSGYGGKIDVAVKTIQKSDYEFYVFGYTNSNPNAMNPNGTLGFFYFLRDSTGATNPNFPGNIVNVNNTEIHFVDRVSPALGDGFIVIGTSQNNVDVSEIFIAKLRSTLVFEDLQDVTLYNTIKLGRNIRGVSAAGSVTGSYGYLVLGNEVRSTGALNIWLTKIDQSGNILWSSTFGSELENDSGAAVAELPDGKIVVLGTMGLADNQSKMALIKLNPSGELLK